MVSGRCLAGLVLLACVTGLVSGQGGIWPPDDTTVPADKYWSIPDAQRVIEKVMDMSVDSHVPAKNRDVILRVCPASHGRHSSGMAYIVGGFVRDGLRNAESKDIDVGYRRVSTGDASSKWDTAGVCEHLSPLVSSKYRSRAGPICKVGAPLPGQAGYVTPLELVDGSISVAAENTFRDFSVNAVYYDVVSKRFYDPTGYGIIDTMTNTLRLACFGESACDGNAWFTGLSGGTEYRKVQRYWHMRMKGYEPEHTTRKKIMDVFTHHSNSVREKVLNDVAGGLDKQTLNYQLCADHEKCVYKLSLLIAAAAEDFAAYYKQTLNNVYKTKVATELLAPLWVEKVASSSRGRYKVRARTSTFRGQLYVSVGDSAVVQLEENRSNVERESAPDWQYVTCSRDCDTIKIDSNSRRYFQALADVHKFTTFGHKPVSASDLVVPVGAKSKSACRTKVKIALYETALYDGLTVRRLREINDGSRDTWADFVKFRSNMRNLEDKVMSTTMTYPGVEYITKKFLLDYIKTLTSSAPVEMTRAGISWVDVPGGFDVTSESFVEAVNNGNSREHFFLMWNLVTRLPDAWVRSGRFETASNILDPCQGSTTLPMPPGWVYLNYLCDQGAAHPDPYKADFCASPRQSYSDPGAPPRPHFKFDTTNHRNRLNPPLSTRERARLKSDKTMDWNMGINVYTVRDDMLPNPLAGEHAVQGGFKHQALSNGFSVLAGASGSGLYIMEFARRYLNWRPEDLALLRLGLMASMPTTKGHSMYEAMMAAEPYMPDELRLLDLPAAQYVNLGAEGLLPSTITTLKLGAAVHNGRGHTVSHVAAEAGETYGQGHYVKWLASQGITVRTLVEGSIKFAGKKFATASEVADYVKNELQHQSPSHPPDRQEILASFMRYHASKGIYVYRAAMNLHAMSMAMLATIEHESGYNKSSVGHLLLEAIKKVVRASFEFAIDINTGLPQQRKPALAATAMSAASQFATAVLEAYNKIEALSVERCTQEVSKRGGENIEQACGAYGLEAAQLAYKYAYSARVEAKTLLENIQAETFSNRMSRKCMNCQLAAMTMQYHSFGIADTIVDVDAATLKYCSDDEGGFTNAVWGPSFKPRNFWEQAPYPSMTMAAFTYYAIRGGEQAGDPADEYSYASVCPMVVSRILTQTSSKVKNGWINDMTGAPLEGSQGHLWATTPRLVCESLSYCSSEDVQERLVRYTV